MVLVFPAAPARVFLAAGFFSLTAVAFAELPLARVFLTAVLVSLTAVAFAEPPLARVFLTAVFVSLTAVAFEEPPTARVFLTAVFVSLTAVAFFTGASVLLTSAPVCAGNASSFTRISSVTSAARFSCATSADPENYTPTRVLS